MTVTLFQCPNCSGYLDTGLKKDEDGNIFCPHCGSKLKTDTNYAGAGAHKAGCIGSIIGAIIGYFIGLSLNAEFPFVVAVIFYFVGWGVTASIAQGLGK
jgi:hypothetical protein